MDRGGGGRRHREGGGGGGEERRRKGMGTRKWTVEEADDNIKKGKVEAEEEERTRSSCPEEAEEGPRPVGGVCGGGG